MPAPWRRSRRSRYAGRAHDVETRHTRPDLPAVDDDDKVIWYRGQDGDHAFGAGPTSFLRSRCGDVRWDVRMHVVEGTVRPCAGCMAVIAPLPTMTVAPATESELHAMDGNR